MKFEYEEQLKIMKKNLLAHNEKVAFGPASSSDLFYLRSCKIPESIMNFYQFAEPDDVVEINESRLWPVSILKLENEKIEPGRIVFPRGYFVIGTTIFGDCYCANLNTSSKTSETQIVIVFHDRLNIHASEKNILENMKVVANSFPEFLTQFSKGKLKVE